MGLVVVTRIFVPYPSHPHKLLRFSSHLAALESTTSQTATLTLNWQMYEPVPFYTHKYMYSTYWVGVDEKPK